MSKTSDFYQKDFWSGLFPMQTNLLMITRKERELSDYIYQKVLSEDAQHNFIAQQRVHADKSNGHLRRTLKLDPVAEYFLYDIVHRNKGIFRKPYSENRKSYGYRFESGAMVPISVAYKNYRQEVGENLQKFKHHLSFDVAGFFNGVYHHDLAHWFSSFGNVTNKDSEAFSKFFREINSGRSVDFLPHGLYPAKMIGSDFLKFTEQSGQLKSSVILRFMDDYHLFDDNESNIKRDFIRIQKMLGDKGLNVNPQKTRKSVQNVQEQVSTIRQELSEIVEVEIGVLIYGSGIEVPEVEYQEIITDLSSDQIQQLLGFLKEDALDDNDADFILNILKFHSTEISDYLPIILERFPSLSKNIFTVFNSQSLPTPVVDHQLAIVIREFLSSAESVSEFQLFWLAIVAENRLSGTSLYGEILNFLYGHSSNSIIAKAKVLEIPTQKFGMKELREEHLKNGSSDWLSWASAMGSRTLKKAERNYVLDYFSKGSSLNFLISSCVKDMD
ncbi:antiviral reverse transcriptase Drt5 [Pseudomonas syringae]|uniref:antiviral reverse transcriptase Drt5 n=1 Tax=Pseudomonas syringae TaxID=317 RepID=UPI000731D4F2|nr:antiviral reverse transcriptase Drt5 [Pseudomonas syringae]KTB97564.1 hypothetical protein AO386_15100 [Pseudomonas syringae ICMP 11292]